MINVIHTWPWLFSRYLPIFFKVSHATPIWLSLWKNSFLRVIHITTTRLLLVTLMQCRRAAESCYDTLSSLKTPKVYQAMPLREDSRQLRKLRIYLVNRYLIINMYVCCMLHKFQSKRYKDACVWHSRWLSLYVLLIIQLVLRINTHSVCSKWVATRSENTEIDAFVQFIPCSSAFLQCLK